MFREGVERNIIGVYARDDMDIRENLSAMLALRFDYYTKEKNLYPSAQIGLVYSANEELNLKLNYGHAYRLPSWIQQYTIEHGPDDGMREGNPDLRAETTDTFEAIAIYRYGYRHHLQGNVYYSIIDDVIDIYEPKGSDTYANQSSRSSYGIELDYTLLFGAQNRFNINFTYNKTTYESVKKQIEQTMPGVAQVMAKGSYLHYITPMVSFSALIKYIGKRPRNHEFDNSQVRENLDIASYTTVDLTFNVSTGSHWDIHASIKNIFDEDVYYPSYYNRHPGGIPRDGRNFLLQTEYKF
jgi:iron complex outermembrane receptor protein